MNAVTALELGLLAATCSPGVRLLVDPRLLRLAPGASAALGGLLVVYAALVTYLALRLPGGLHAVALVAGGLWSVSLWRAREGYGRSRGLPPGSLSLASSIEAIVDRRFYRKQHDRYGPIFKMAQFHRGVICVVGIERGHRLIRERHDALGPGTLPFTHEISGGFLRYMEPKTHDIYGSLFRSAFSGAVVRAAETVTREAARRELGDMAEACSTSADGMVRPTDYLDRVVFASFMRVMFDVVPETEVFRRFESLYADLREQSLSRPLTARTKAALEALRALVFREAERVRERTEDGRAPSCALEALRRADPAMPDLTCVDNLVFILKISSANVAGLLHWSLKLLDEHPQWMDRVREELDVDGQQPGRPGLVDRIVMETLRLEQSEYLYRTIRRSFEHDGYVFPQGWLLRICVRESHRDAEVFADPEAFDPDRFLSHRFTRAEYSPFGSHQHACNGVELTNMIARVLIQELARGFDWKIVRDGHLERDFRHWSHWRPSAKLRLTMSRRSRLGRAATSDSQLRAGTSRMASNPHRRR